MQYVETLMKLIKVDIGLDCFITELLMKERGTIIGEGSVL